MKYLKVFIFISILSIISNIVYCKDISQTELNNIIQNKLQELYSSQDVQDYMIKIWSSDKFLDFKQSKEYQKNLTLVKLDKEITNRKNTILNNLRKSNPKYDSLFNEIAARKRQYAGEWEGSDEFIKILYENNPTLLYFDKEFNEKTARDTILLNLNLQYGNAFRKDTQLVNLFNLRFPEVDKFIREKVNKCIEEISKKYGKDSKIVANKFISPNSIQFETYSSEDNQKAQGLNFTIDYPVNWEVKEGNNPHILKTFKYSYKDFVVMIMIQLQNSEHIMSNNEIRTELNNMNDNEIKQLVAPATVTKYEIRNYDNQPGISFYTKNTQQIGIETYNILSLTHIIYFQNTATLIMCQISANTNIPIEKLTQEANKYYPLFNRIGDSFVINNKEEYAQSHIKKTSFFQDLVSMLYKEKNLRELPEYMLILLLLFSFILTWTIPLGEALIIRFLILKKTMAKDSAIITSIILYVVNVAIFIALGSKSKTHTALIIATYISYLILRNKSKNSNIDDKPTDKEIKDLLKESKFFKDKKEGE